MLAAVAKLSGSFLTQRFSVEAWPQLARLLREGPAVHRAPYMLPEDEHLAPAVLQRARLAVLACLSMCGALNMRASMQFCFSRLLLLNLSRELRCRSCLCSMAGSEQAAPAMRHVVAEAAEAAAAFLGSGEAPAVRNAACHAILALSALDADAVWLLLVRLEAQDGPSRLSLLEHPKESTLPALADIFRASRGAGLSMHSPGTSARARVLLAQVEKLVPAWHARASVEELSYLAA